jgi:hypothetical protein
MFAIYSALPEISWLREANASCGCIDRLTINRALSQNWFL